MSRKYKEQLIKNTVMGKKYARLQVMESHQVHSQTMFYREYKNLDSYFDKQMQNYAKDLETRAAKIEQRLNSDFVVSDWNFDSSSREWQNSSKSLTIKLEKHESSQVSVLRDRLVHFYV